MVPQLILRLRFSLHLWFYNENYVEVDFTELECVTLQDMGTIWLLQCHEHFQMTVYDP
jgi:hypothetical protein